MKLRKEIYKSMENEKLHHDSSGPLYLTIQEWQGLSKAFDRGVKLLSNYRQDQRP